MPSSIISNVGRNLSLKNKVPGDLVSIYSSAIKAIVENNFLELSYILEQDYLISLLDKDSLGSLLLKACEINAQLAISMAIMNLGANVNFRSGEQSNTPLMLATKNGDKQLVESLLQFGAKVNITDKFAWTALFYASYFGKIDCAEVLLEHGAHVDSIDCDKMSCLIWAAGRGHVGVVELLLKYGAPVNVSDGYNTSALIWACRKGNTMIAKLLLEYGAQINERGMYGWSPLIVAVKNNHLETTRLLLEFKPNLNDSDSELMSPLMIACKEGYEEIALELIKRGALVNQPDSFGNTSLIFAASIKCKRLIEALVKAGAYIEHMGQDERNAVHWSIIRDDVESCRLFLQMEIDTKLKTSSGETYLMLAAKHCSWNVIKLLEEYELKNIS